MDARDFYSQIDKADDELKAVSDGLWKMSNDADHLYFIFKNLSEESAQIEDEDKREMFESELAYLSELLDEIGEKCCDISAEIDKVRELNLSELIVRAEEIAEEEEKNSSN